MKNQKTILTTKELNVGYASKVGAKLILENLNLSLEKGKLTCLLGVNGAGKSTLMRSLAGIQKSLNGEVLIYGRAVSSISPKAMARQLSLVLTDRVAPGNLTAYALVSLGRFPYTGWLGTLSDKDKAVIHQAMEATGSLPFANTHIGELSDGEKQKVMIARTLAQDTEIIFLDEPTAHLDLPNRIEIFHLLRKLALEGDKAILLSTHEVDMALTHADQLWLVTRQHSIAQGCPEDLVLGGQFEKAFQKEHLRFDYELGTFKRTEGSNLKNIALEGDVMLKRWTKSALERAGYSISESDTTKKVTVSGTPGSALWYLNTTQETYKSIQELLKHI